MIGRVTRAIKHALGLLMNSGFELISLLLLILQSSVSK